LYFLTNFNIKKDHNIFLSGKNNAYLANKFNRLYCKILKFIVMKNLLFSVTLFFLSGLSALAQQNQVKVNSGGILIGSGTALSTYNIMLTNTGNNTNGAYVNNNTAVTSGNYVQALSARQPVGISKDVGVRVYSYSPAALSSARSYGVYSTTGNATSGYNYSLYSDFYGSNFGTALYASHGMGLNDYIDRGKYAGYFMGRVYMSERLGIGYTTPSYALDVVGTIRATTVTTLSDSRLKTNIADLGGSLGKIGKLRPVTYNLKPDDYSEYYDIYKKSGAADTGKVVISGDDDLRKYFALDEKREDGRRHIGFVAQELKEVFPELVYEDEKGMLSVDYVSLVPVLVQTIQELSGTIQKLNERLDAVENKNASANVQGGRANNFSFSIFPNPANGFVTIDYQMLVDAPISMELYSMYGQRVKMILSNQSKSIGAYNIQTSVSDLTAGTYILKVTSGNQVESQQLVVNR
jgi:hypothetical protein